MLTRNSSAQPKGPAPQSATRSTNGAQSPTSPASSGEKSVIGSDLRILGQGLKIVCRGVLQVDGEVEGECKAPS
jgi:hypothetical protein